MVDLDFSAFADPVEPATIELPDFSMFADPVEIPPVKPVPIPVKPVEPKAAAGPLDYISEFGKQIVPGAVKMVGSTLRGTAIGLSDNKKAVTAVESGMSQIDEMDPDQFRQFQQSISQYGDINLVSAFNYQRAAIALRDGKLEDAQRFLETARSNINTSPIEGQKTYQRGAAIEKSVSGPEWAPSPGWEGSLTAEFGSALGSILAFIPAGLLAGPTGVITTGGAAQIAEQYDVGQQQLAKLKEGLAPDSYLKGLSPDEAQKLITRAAKLGFGPGATEDVPIEMLLDQTAKRIPGLRIFAKTPAFQRFLKRAGRVVLQATAEGGQEFGQQVGGNIITKMMLNPDQKWDDKAWRAGLIGAVAGGGIQTGISTYEAIVNRPEAPDITVRPEGALPPGAPPPGATELGVADGYRVWATPDGKRWIGDEQKGFSPVAPRSRLATAKIEPSLDLDFTDQAEPVEEAELPPDMTGAPPVGTAPAAPRQTTRRDMSPNVVEAYGPRRPGRPNKGIRDIATAAAGQTGMDEVNFTSGKGNWISPRGRARGQKSTVHSTGNAVDVGGFKTEAQKYQFIENAVANGATGIGIYEDGNVHIDTGSERSWNWGDKKNDKLLEAAIARGKARREGGAAPVQTAEGAKEQPSGSQLAAEPIPGGLDFSDQAEPVTVGEGTRAAPAQVTAQADLEVARTNVELEPTEAQKEAGNYRKGHATVQGVDVTIENPKGSTRTGTDAEGKPWSVEMPADYGYVKRTEGKDGDQVDVFIGPDPKSDKVFVVDQVNPDTKVFDEHKAIMGTRSAAQARRLYTSAFSDKRGIDRIGNITEMPVAEFKEWVSKGPQKKPAGGPIPKPGTAPMAPRPQPKPAQKILAEGQNVKRETSPATPKGAQPQEGGAAASDVAAQPEATKATGKPVEKVAQPDGITHEVRPTTGDDEKVQGKFRAFASRQKPWNSVDAYGETAAEATANALAKLNTTKGAKSEVKAASAKIPGDQREGEASVPTHNGMKVGDRVTVKNRTIGPSVIEALWNRNIMGDRNSVIARVRDDSGKQLVVGAPELEKTEAEAEAPMPAAKQEEPKAEPKVAKAETGGDLLQALREFFTGSDNSFATITEARKFAATHGFIADPGTKEAKQLDEIVENAVVLAARDIVKDSKDPGTAYERLVGLYGRQPNLAVRTSLSMADQAYSTPVPLAYLASRLAGVAEASLIFEPTAGNGALLIEAEPSKVIANELNPDRRAALAAQGFKATGNDASKPAQALAIKERKDGADVVIANPPFGAVRDNDGRSTDFAIDGWQTTQIDHVIALASLKAMADKGRSVFIVGSVNEPTDKARSDAYNSKSKREFYWRLYQAYNVIDHFTVDGDLYRKQGAQWPVDVIVIAGRGKSARRLPAVDLPRVYGSWEALKEKLDEARDRPTADVVARAEIREPAGEGDGAEIPAGLEAGSEGDSVDAGGGIASNVVPFPGQPGAVRVRDGEREPADAGEQLPPEPADAGVEAAGRDERVRDRVPPRAPRERIAEQATEDPQQPYRPMASGPSLGTRIPTNMATAVEDSLADLVDRHGDLNEWIEKELGYKPGELAEYLAAEQVDALAMAIDNVQKNAAFIIGDQTGIGKGRVVAGALRYAMRKGLTPIFLTEKPNLYGDIIRDLDDIGIAKMLGRDIRPFTTNPGITVPLDDDAAQWFDQASRARLEGKPQPPRRGKFLRSASGANHKRLMQAIAQNGVGKGQPFDLIFSTYDQMNTVKGEATDRRRLIAALAGNAFVVLDESHNAGGTEASGWQKKDAQDNRSDFLKKITQEARAVMFSSATYAKRPGTMALYAKTDMGKAVEKPEMLGELISHGGVPMQQVVAAMLAKAGQYVRRERTFDGVSYDVEAVPVDEDAYANLSDGISKIAAFDLSFKDSDAYVHIKDSLKNQASAIAHDSGVGQSSVQGTNFTSIMHNIVSQMLLSLKANAVADRAIEALKAGEKPVITVANTMGAFLADAGIAKGEKVKITFRDVLGRYLTRTMRVTISDPQGGKSHRQIPLDALPSGLRRMYDDAAAAVAAIETERLPLSPIDWIKFRLHKAGYSIAEITGRKLTIDYSGPDEGVMGERRDSEISTAGRRVTVDKFNSGKTDALIMNRAGSAGLSLHASEKFKDKRRRRMVVAQAENNIDTHMQMLGRVHRTGQVVPPAFSQAYADVPAEARPAAVLAKKMASLNANTTAARRSAFSADDSTDFLNQYGDQVAREYLTENWELALKLDVGLDTDKETARILTGRLLLLPVPVQRQVLDDIMARYRMLIDSLNATGENALEAKTMDLKARTVARMTIKQGEGESPFTQAAILETVEVQAPGLALPINEIVQAVSEHLTGQPTTETDPVKALTELNRVTVAKSHDERLNNALVAFDRMAEAEEAAAKKDETKRDRQEKNTAHRSRWLSISSILFPGRRVDITFGTGETMTGIVMRTARRQESATGGGNPLAFGAWSAEIAVPDNAQRIIMPFSAAALEGEEVPEGTRKIHIAHNRMGWPAVIEAFAKAQMMGTAERHILTGNVLTGFEQTKGKGQIVNFTDDKGNVRPGIMMGKQFNPQEFLAERHVTFKTAEQVAQFLAELPAAEIDSRDALVSIRLAGHNTYEIDMPAGRGTGGVYFLHPKVRQSTNDGFVKVGARMRYTAATRADLVRVLQAIMDAGAMFQTTEHQDVAERIMGIAPPAPEKPVLGSLNRGDRVQRAAQQKAVKPIAETLRIAAASFGYKIVDTGLPFGATDHWGKFHSFGTQLIDRLIPGDKLHQSLDNLKAATPEVRAYIKEHMTAPWFHRVWFGHDPLANLGMIVDKFGVSSLPDYFAGLLKDSMSTAGIPLPGVQWLVQAGIVGDKAATNWLSLNVGEALSGGLSVLGTYRLYKQARDGKPIHKGWAIAGILFKTIGGILSANPVVLLSAAADVEILVRAHINDVKRGMAEMERRPPKKPTLGSAATLPATQFVATKAQVQEARGTVDRIAQQILGHRLRVITTDQMPAFIPSEFTGAFSPSDATIWISMKAAHDLAYTTGHEALHALREINAIRDTEWRALAAAAKRHGFTDLSPERMAIYDRAYREKYGLSRAEFIDKIEEEGVADMFGAYVDGRETGKISDAILGRIKEFIEAVLNMMKGMGFETPTKIMRKGYEGRLAERADGGSRSQEAIFGATGRRIPAPRRPGPGSFAAPHEERVMAALMDSTDTLLNRIKRAGKSAFLEGRRDLQDVLVDLTRTQKAIETAQGAPIPEFMDAYLAATLYPTRTAQRHQDLLDDVVKPLIEEIHRRGLTLEEVDEFNKARHAIERNREIGALYPPGHQFNEAITDPTVTGGSGWSTNDVRASLDAFRRAGKVADLKAVGDKIVALNRRTLGSLLTEGLIDQDQYDSLTAKYRYYIPLRGFDDVLNPVHPDASGKGKGFDTRGREFQTAFGRTSEADSPLAYSILQARSAIDRIETNRVGKRFLRLAVANPNKSFWEVSKVVMKKTIDPNTGYVREYYDRGTQQAENDYAVKVNGKTYHVTLYHEGLLNGMKALGRPSMGAIFAGMHKAMRLYAMVNTSLSPQFLFTNFLKDVQTAGIYLQEEKIKGLPTRIMKSLPLATAGMNRMLKGDLSTPWAKRAREFADAGGKLNFLDRADIEKEKANLARLKKEMDPSLARKTVMVMRDEFLGRIDRWNNALENTLRLATYVALRDAGVSQDKSAAAALEITVNFTRKGKLGPHINALYVFFNARIQGTANMIIRIARSPKLRKIAVGIVVGALLQDMLNRMIAGDDDDGENRYDKIDDNLKMNYMIFMLPDWAEKEYGVPYFKFPMAHGFNTFHVAGTQIGHMLAGARLPLEAAGNVGAAVINSFNPIDAGRSLLNFIAPTFVDPVADIAANKDYFGQDIVPRVYDDTIPMSARYKKSVNPLARDMARLLNEWTGGNDMRSGKIDWSPEWIEHFAGFATGALGRMASDTITTVATVMRDEAVDANRIPIVRVFLGQDSRYSDVDQYFEIKDAVELAEKELKARKAERDVAAVQDVRTDHAKELKMVDFVDRVDKKLTKLRKDRKTILNLQGINETARKNRLEKINEHMDELMLKVRQRWNKLDEAPAR